MSKSKMATCESGGHEISSKGKVTYPSCERVKKKFFYKRICSIGLVLILLLSAVGCSGSDDSSTATSESDSNVANAEEVVKEEVVKEEVETREPVVVTVDSLMDALEENSLKASETYKDQYVELTGSLDVIDSSGNYIGLGRMDTDYGFITVRCDINEEHINQVLAMDKGDKVTVLGTISDVGEVMGYSLAVDEIVGGETAAAEGADEETAAVESADSNEPIVITVDELVDALKENALKASNKYKEKKVELTGKVESIDSSGEYFTLGIMSDEFSLDSIMCMIEEEHLNDVMEFQDGQTVTVLGTISDVGEVMGYTVKVETIN